VWKRIQGWKEKLLSKAGKEILVKVIARAIPTYAMSCFDLTKSLCDDITSMIYRYWWSSQEKENKVLWLASLGYTLPKEENKVVWVTNIFNLAMLARQGWRLLMFPKSLCAQVLKAKYFPDGNILDADEM
jgi:hypothetical protein